VLLGGHVGRDQTRDALGSGLGDEQDKTFIRQVNQGPIRFGSLRRPVLGEGALSRRQVLLGQTELVRLFPWERQSLCHRVSG